MLWNMTVFPKTHVLWLGNLTLEYTPEDLLTQDLNSIYEVFTVMATVVDRKQSTWHIQHWRRKEGGYDSCYGLTSGWRMLPYI